MFDVLRGDIIYGGVPGCWSESRLMPRRWSAVATTSTRGRLHPKPCKKTKQILLPSCRPYRTRLRPGNPPTHSSSRLCWLSPSRARNRENAWDPPRKWRTTAFQLSAEGETALTTATTKQHLNFQIPKKKLTLQLRRHNHSGSLVTPAWYQAPRAPPPPHQRWRVSLFLS